jgi:hypothetical protein
MPVSTAFPALADTRSEIIATLQSKTNIPVEFPRRLPNTEGKKIYFNQSVDPNNYEVNFDYTQDCGGATACRIGSFSAYKGAHVPSNSNYLGDDEYQYIKLSNGYSAVFTNSCGAYCSASVRWQINGVLYSVNLKNGTKEEAIKIANSVYK